MSGFKQRLTGALVLVCLAVIFVPMLFDEPHEERVQHTLNVPKEPPFPEVPVQREAPEPPPMQYYVEEDPEPEAETETGANADAMAQSNAETEPAPTSNAQSRPEAQPKPAPEKKSTAATTQPNPAPKAESAEFTRSLDGAWIVQLGSFGDAANANRLREKVRDKGYSAHLQTINTSSGTMTRVFAGPFVERQDADKAKSQLDSTFSINSLVSQGGL